jgi:hypothetical protein
VFTLTPVATARSRTPGQPVPAVELAGEDARAQRPGQLHGQRDVAVAVERDLHAVSIAAQCLATVLEHQHSGPNRRRSRVLPMKNLLEEVGDLMILTGKTIVAAIRPPYPYGGEFVNQFLFALKLCWFPLIVSTVAFGYGAPGLQAANLFTLFGSIDRLGGFFVLASIREFAPFVTAIIVSRCRGTAITADLGAARSARSSTRCRSSASTRSRTSSSRASSR